MANRPVLKGKRMKPRPSWQVIDNYGVTWKKGLTKGQAEEEVLRLKKRFEYISIQQRRRL